MSHIFCLLSLFNFNTNFFNIEKNKMLKTSINYLISVWQTLVLQNGTAPWLIKVWIITALSSAGLSRNLTKPSVESIPFTSKLSLTLIGRPCKTPRCSNGNLSNSSALVYKICFVSILLIDFWSNIDFYIL